MAMPLSLETAEYEFLVSPLSSVQGLATEPATLSVKVRLARCPTRAGSARVTRTTIWLPGYAGPSTFSHNLPKEEMPDFLGDYAYAMVVADGMGGMNAGDVASMLAISTGSSWPTSRSSGGSRSTRKKPATCSPA